MRLLLSVVNSVSVVDYDRFSSCIGVMLEEEIG